MWAEDLEQQFITLFITFYTSLLLTIKHIFEKAISLHTIVLYNRPWTAPTASECGPVSVVYGHHHMK